MNRTVPITKCLGESAYYVVPGTTAGSREYITTHCVQYSSTSTRYAY